MPNSKVPVHGIFHKLNVLSKRLIVRLPLMDSHAMIRIIAFSTLTHLVLAIKEVSSIAMITMKVNHVMENLNVNGM
jgi:hypothetical protein